MNKKFGSDYNSLIERSHNFESMIFSGMDMIENITGCKECCNNIRYKLNLVHSVPTKVQIIGWEGLPLAGGGILQKNLRPGGSPRPEGLSL